MHKPITIALIFLLVIFINCLPARAVTPEELVYVTENFEPYNYEENSQMKGVAVDLLRLVWQQMGVKPQKISVYPWARGYSMLQHQSNVVLFTTARTQEREKLFKWVGPITIRGQRCVLVAKKDRGIKIESLEDAKQYRIGTVREDYAEQLILNMGIAKTTIEPVSNMMSNLYKIQARRIDLIAYTEKSFYKIIETAGFNTDDFESVYLIKEVFPCYAFSKAIPEILIEQFQGALDKVKQGPEYQKLLEKYKFE